MSFEVRENSYNRNQDYIRNYYTNTLVYIESIYDKTKQYQEIRVEGKYIIITARGHQTRQGARSL